jgi:hypothetical protein
MLNRRAAKVESLRKVMADIEKQFVDCLQQIKTLGEEKEQRQKELDDLKAAAQELVEMVDPREDGAEDEPPLLDRLRGAPQKDPQLRHRGRHNIRGSCFRPCEVLLAKGSARSTRRGHSC